MDSAGKCRIFVQFIAPGKFIKVINIIHLRMRHISSLKALFAIGALVAFFGLSESFAQPPPGGQQVYCARQLNACKRQCDAMKAEAKRALDQCEAACRATYSQCGTTAACKAALDACIRQCRATYASAIQQANECYRNCWSQYQLCLQGGYDSQPPG